MCSPFRESNEGQSPPSGSMSDRMRIISQLGTLIASFRSTKRPQQTRMLEIRKLFRRLVRDDRGRIVAVPDPQPSSDRGTPLPSCLTCHQSLTRSTEMKKCRAAAFSGRSWEVSALTIVSSREVGKVKKTSICSSWMQFRTVHCEGRALRTRWVSVLARRWSSQHRGAVSMRINRGFSRR